MSFNNIGRDYKEENKSRNNSIVPLIFLLLFTGILISAFVVNTKKVDEIGKHIFISKNSIGCGRYRFNGDYYWKCPKDLEINQIEYYESEMVGRVRHTKIYQEPVIGVK